MKVTKSTAKGSHRSGSQSHFDGSPLPTPLVLMAEKVFVVEAADATYASRNRVLMTQATMVEMGFGIGEHLVLTSIPASESRSRRSTRQSSETVSRLSDTPKRAFGIAWPGVTNGPFSTQIL